MRRLHIPGRNVVQNGVTEHIVPGLSGWHVLCIPAQHHGQFALVVQLLHKVGVGFNKTAVRHRAGHTFGKINSILMFGCKGIGGVLFGFVRVRHVVDAKADHILRRAGNGALHLHSFHRKRGDAADGQLQSGTHLRCQEGNGV